MIDLHVHTNTSDGELPPQEVVKAAIKAGLRAIAITDHDTIRGIPAAMEYAEGKDIEVIPALH